MVRTFFIFSTTLWAGLKAELMCEKDQKHSDRVCTAKICEYHWVLAERHSMAWRTKDHSDGRIKEYELRYNKKDQKFKVKHGGFYTNRPKHENGTDKDPNEELANIIPLDGREYRRVITINGEFPGPVIRVAQGSIVKVAVHNQMPIQAATVHWHGILQRNNYWMDGGAYLSQCPILPHQDFTYVWKAEHAGTFWYHSHLANQRMDGIFGGIIISEPDAPSGIPLVMFDWFQTNSLDLVTSNPFGHAGIAMAHCNHENEGFSFAGVKVSSLCMDSILVNGYGQYRNPLNHSIGAISIRETYLVPEAETFVVVHLIHAGFEFPLRFYRHDRERLEVIETDGGAVDPQQVDDVIIGVGETYVIKLPVTWEGDLLLRSELLVECKGYLCYRIQVPFFDIRIRRCAYTTEIDKFYEIVSSNDSVPMPKQPICSSNRKCKTLNCPWRKYPDRSYAKYANYECVAIHHVKRSRYEEVSGRRSQPVYVPQLKETPDKIFNVTFNFAVGSSINNIKFQYPSAPFYHTGEEQGIVKCPAHHSLVPTKGIQCTQILEAELGDVIEIRFVGAENPRVNRRRLMWTYHTAHLHGYDMFLLDMGFPVTYRNGTIKSMNTKLSCKNPSCSVHDWVERKILHRNCFDRPIMKNTILVPSQGFAIVRFKADNPGWWPLHCHNAMHNMEGMMLLLHVADSKHNRPLSIVPNGLPRCGQHKFKSTDLYPWELEPQL